MKNRIMLVFFALGVWFTSFGQNTSQLDQYIEQGLKSNLVVQQRSLSLENALNALKQARGLFLPTFDFQAQYLSAEGGRYTELPLGDFLNPIFNTVNGLMGAPLLPEVKNERINFLPNNYYDARFRLSVPILNTDIIHNNSISKKQLAIKENELEIYERELVKEIKVAYYHYLAAVKAQQVYHNSLTIAEESKRVNEKLVQAGNGLPAYILRSESEIEQIKSQLKTVELQANSLQRYFNALLNREENAEIIVENSESIIPFVDKAELTAQNREELNSLQLAVALRQDLVKMKKHAFVPTLGGFLDLGSQAEDFKFNDKSMYYMVGLQLNIPIFQGNRNNLKIKEAKNELEIAKLQEASVAQQLEVAVNNAYNEVLTEKSKYESSLKQLEMAETYHRLIEKGYAAGTNTYLESIDARSQLSSAKLATNINYYQFLAALARLERETASYPLTK